MCGRYQAMDEESILELREIIDEINRRHQGADAARMAAGEVFPTNLAPVIARDGPRPMRWGFPMTDKRQVIINARAETARARPMFAKALMEGRLAVPTAGFYEWKREGAAKDKYLFKLPGEPVLYLAALYAEFHLSGGIETRFAILTTAANDSMLPYHDRMPVVLERQELPLWLNDDHFTEEALRRPQRALTARRIEPPVEQMRLF